MKTYRLLLFFILAVLCFPACTRHYYYVPNTLSIPVIRVQHDANISIGVITTDYESGQEVKGFYSPVKYAALMFNHASLTHGNRTQTGANSFAFRITEGAIGAYYPKYPFTFSLFAGYGKGITDHTYPDERVSPSSDLKAYLTMQRLFFQGAVDFRSRGIKFGFGARLSRLHFNAARIDASIEAEELEALRLIQQGTPFLLPELGSSLGFRIRPVLLTWDFTRIATNGRELKALQLARSSNSLTLTFELHALWKKKEESLKVF